MPIRPENRARYPQDWKQISLEVRERDGWQCACAGECGRGHTTRCEKKRGDVGRRLWPVVITVAHLDHQPENCGEPGNRPNLKSMCQACHLAYDAQHHQQTAYNTRRSRKAAGDLFP